MINHLFRKIAITVKQEINQISYISNPIINLQKSMNQVSMRVSLFLFLFSLLNIYEEHL